jgi:predicted ribosomally synthesized peptide with nif11-like leader
MSTTEVSRLLGDVRKAPYLMAELKGLVHDLDAAARWAGEKGYDIAREEIRELRDCDQELSEDELDKVAGGDTAWSPGSTTGSTTPPPTGGG